MRGINGQQFEGSYLGDRTRLPLDARLEYKNGWWSHEPNEGDEQSQIAPGTPFAEPPPHRRYPQCDSTADGCPAAACAPCVDCSVLGSTTEAESAHA